LLHGHVLLREVAGLNIKIYRQLIIKHLAIKTNVNNQKDFLLSQHNPMIGVAGTKVPQPNLSWLDWRLFGFKVFKT